MKVLLPAQLTKVASRSDRSYALTFSTRELRGAEAAILLEELQKEGWLLYSPNNDLGETDIPKEKADPMLGTKTQAQRLRGVIYKIWEQNGAKGNFEQYYQTIMEGLIDQLKEKLEN